MELSLDVLAFPEWRICKVWYLQFSHRAVCSFYPQCLSFQDSSLGNLVQIQLLLFILGMDN